MRRVFVMLIAILCALPALTQDSQSIADAARKARLQKQQKEAEVKSSASPTDAQSAKMAHVITNEEIPEHVGSTLTQTNSPQAQTPTYTPQEYRARKIPGDQWKAQIQAQKNAIASLQHEIDSLSASIHFPENCLPNSCAQRNERQIQKEDRVEIMKQQLEQNKKLLEELQDSARKQGFGTAVYDP